jgi:uncharacterized protein (DUF2147 family)
MKYSKILVCFILLLCSFCAKAQKEIVGKWKIESGKAIVEIFEEKGKFNGKITWLAQPNNARGKPRVDEKNPNPKLRNRKLLGLVVLHKFEYKNKEWKNGLLYNPETGDVYNCKMWLKDNNTLIGRGYLGLVFKTQIWTRVQ